jgi:hypothetical protein
MNIRHLLMRHSVRVDAVIRSKVPRGLEYCRIPVAFNAPPQNRSV